jgi:hypothetical protein
MAKCKSDNYFKFLFLDRSLHNPSLIHHHLFNAGLAQHVLLCSNFFANHNMFISRKQVPEVLLDVCTPDLPALVQRRVVYDNPSTERESRHVIATRKVIQISQAEGAFLKGEDSVFFS